MWRLTVASLASLLLPHLAGACPQTDCESILSPDGDVSLVLTPDKPALAGASSPFPIAAVLHENKGERRLALPAPLRAPHLVQVNNGGNAAAILVREQGLWVWSPADKEAFRPVSASAPLANLVSLDTLMYFSDDGQFLYINPLRGDPVVVYMADGTLLADAAMHRRTIQRGNLLKSRILLFAEDDRLKLAGLHWAVELQDTRFVALIARYAELGNWPVLRHKAREVLDAYLRNAYDGR